MKRICVFCGSKTGVKAEYSEVAKYLGKLLAVKKIGLVYGGAQVGLMGVLADSALANGGEVIGVIPKHLVSKEIAHSSLSDLRIVNSMHERKALMADLSDAFIALPGGLGTFEELFEMLTWAQLGLQQKPIGLLNVQDYYSPLLQLVEIGIREDFIPKENKNLLLQATDPETLLQLFATYQPIKVNKWIKRTSEA